MNEAKRADLLTDAIAEMQTEADWQRHDAFHDGEHDDPETCWICGEQLDTFLRFGETLTDDMVRHREFKRGELARIADLQERAIALADIEGYVTVPLDWGGELGNG